MSLRFSFPMATELRVCLVRSTYGLDYRRFITDERAGLVVGDELSAGALAEGDDRGAIDHRFDHHRLDWFRPAGSPSAPGQPRASSAFFRAAIDRTDEANGSSRERREAER